MSANQVAIPSINPEPNPSITTPVATHPAIAYLNALFLPDDFLCIVLIDGHEHIEHLFATTREVARESYLAELTKFNSMGFSVYVCMTPLKKGSASRKKENVAAIRAVFAEVDSEGERVKAAVEQSTHVPKPHFILRSSPAGVNWPGRGVNSSAKYQFIWCVEDTTREENEKTLRGLIAEFGTDKAVTDCNRVLRLPGFNNCKYDERPVVEIVSDFFDGHDYRKSDFHLSSVMAVAPKPPFQAPEQIPEGERNDTLHKLACSLRAKGLSDDAVRAGVAAENQAKCSSPLDADELRKLLDSALKPEHRETDRKWREQHAPVETPREVKAKPAQAETSVEPGPGPTEPSPIPADITPAYPNDTIDGDMIGELTRALTDGTFIPPQFMRENIKVAVGIILDGYVGFPNHEDLHLRTYLHNVSPYPQSGKGESYKRATAPGTGFLFELLRRFGVGVVDGGLFGSGEFMVKVLKDAPTRRNIARFDEMSEVWAKNRAIGCTLEKKFLTLFESTSAAQGSFKNGTNAADDIRLSLVGDFTKDSFDASYTGSGSRGSGYLSRGVFQFADKQPWTGDWQSTDMEKVNRVLSDIDAQITEVLSLSTRVIPSEDADAKALRLEFYAWLDTQDARYTPRLKDHVKRDALLRAVFGKQPGVPCGHVITAEMMRRSIEWCRNQFDNRTALFPEDAGSPAEIMERCILRVLTTKATASERELKRACHVDRAGSGGHEIFNRALRSLMLGHAIKVVDATRKAVPIYALFDAV